MGSCLSKEIPGYIKPNIVYTLTYYNHILYYFWRGFLKMLLLCLHNFNQHFQKILYVAYDNEIL